ncbi:MAG: universal stress protein [Spirochaetes bacterium]|nr:universal stress protein [Spirochaetota bacterium]
MFGRILVPLDGSKLAEAALPLAIHIARCFQSELILFHGLEDDPPHEVHGEPHIHNREEAEQYFETLTTFLSKEMQGSHVKIQVHIHEERFQNIVTGIVEHIEELKPQLIVLCSHGQASLKNALLGSLPLKILHRGTIPILLVRKPLHTIQEVLVALDTRSLHDNAIEAAHQLSATCGTNLTLLTVVPTVPTLQGPQAASGLHLPRTTRALLDLETLTIHEHLDSHLKQIQVAKRPIHTIVRRGDPVKEILKTAKSLSSCLLVLGTHRKIGLEAFWAGSISSRVVHRADVPILLVPV